MRPADDQARLAALLLLRERRRRSQVARIVVGRDLDRAIDDPSHVVEVAATLGIARAEVEDIEQHATRLLTGRDRTVLVGSSGSSTPR